MTRIVTSLSLLAIWVALAPIPARAEPESTNAPVVTDAPDRPLTNAIVAERMQGAKDTAGLDEATQKNVNDAYKQAITDLQREKEFRESAAKFKQMAEGAEQQLADVKAKLDEVPEDVDLRIPDEESLEKLDALLERHERDLEQATERRKELDAEPARRQTRRAVIPELRDAAAAKINALKEQLTAEAPEGESATVTLARQTRLGTQLQATEQEVAMYDLELAAYDATGPLLRLQRDLSARQAARGETAVDQLKQVVTTRRKQLAEQKARQAEQEAARTHGVLLPIASRNIELAQQDKQLLKHVDAISGSLAEVTAERDAFEKMVTNTKARIEQVGPTDAMGLLLRRQKTQQLPNIAALQQQQHEMDRDIRSAQLKLLELDTERSELAVIERRVDRFLSEIQKPDDLSEENFRQAVRELYRTQREYLDALITDQNQYFEQLVEKSNIEQQLIRDTYAYATYIDERVLWIRSAEPFHWQDVTAAMSALVSLIKTASWSGVYHALVADFRSKPQLVAMFAIIFGLLIYYNRRSRRQLDRIGLVAAERECRSYVVTVRALALTVIIALPWPLLLFFLAWRLHEAAAAEFTAAIAISLRQTGLFFLLFGLLRQICRPNGLAGGHFTWSEDARQAIFRHIRWFLCVFLPLVFIANAMDREDMSENALGRLCLVVFLIVVVVLNHLLLRPRGPLFGSTGGVIRTGWPHRLRYFWYMAGICIPLSLIVLLLQGYVYTAESLVIRLIWTLWMLLGLQIGCSMLLRWLRIKRRRLAWRHDQKQQSLETSSSDDSAAVKPASQMFVPQLPDVDFDAIGQQSRQLINALFAAAAILGVWMVWADVLPALAILNDFVLWTVASGERVQSVTLAHVLLAVLFMLTTILALRNVPGFLELVVLQRLPLDSGARYATVAILRYLITLAGIVATCKILGIVWSDIQWLVAAATVGLGFGLQEIFANFVSGLILLTEQPIRIGDIVTVDNVTGVVSKIRMRATVVTNWDRKEFIIPNKDFISGRVLNWSLTNTVNRVVIMVRIRRDANIEQVRQLLLDVAQNHPAVMTDPGPIATIEDFGDSAINFALRCYLPSMDGRLGIKHQLHAEIHRVFSEAGIEMAYPQRDVHLDSEDEAGGGGRATGKPSD